MLFAKRYFYRNWFIVWRLKHKIYRLANVGMKKIRNNLASIWKLVKIKMILNEVWNWNLILNSIMSTGNVCIVVNTSYSHFIIILWAFFVQIVYSQTVIKEKMHKALSYKEGLRKMLMKWTPMVNFINVFWQLFLLTCN